METPALRAFITVAESGSFSAAAERLFLSQPAVSKRVASLETELGTRLFDRIGRQVLLTEAGRNLLPRAHKLLDQIEDFKRLAGNITGEIEGPLLIGTSHHIGLHRLPPLLRNFTRHFPTVQLDIRFLDSEAACHQVESGELELAIVTLPTQPPPNLRQLALWEDPLQFVVGTAHPLANRGKLTLEELARYPALLPGPTTYTRGILEQVLQEQGLQVTVAMSTNYLETLKMLAQIGLGWSLLPETMIDSSLQTLSTPITLKRNLGIVLHTGRTLSNAASQLVKLLSTSATGAGHSSQ